MDLAAFLGEWARIAEQNWAWLGLALLAGIVVGWMSYRKGSSPSR